MLWGRFDDVLKGKHQNAGSFTVRAFESNALVDVTFENGFREVTGTDGKDTFTYYPFTGNSNAFENPNGRATISYGRFPRNAQFAPQILWLACVHDPELLTNLHTIRFPFDAHYYTNNTNVQIIPKITTSKAPPGLVTSIKWYAPGFVPGPGTNRYTISGYPKGWLMAQVSVGETNAGQLSIPAKIVCTEYNTRFVTNAAQLSQLRNITGPDDVLPVDIITFTVTNAEVESPLQSYVPEILDKTARVDDKRSGMGIVHVVSGKWWTVGAHIAKYKTWASRRRLVVLALLFLLLLFPIYLIAKRLVIGKTRLTNKPHK